MKRKTTAKLSIPQGHTRFVKRQLSAGRFRSADDVVREGLRLLEEMNDFIDSHREEIRRKIEEGAASADRGELIDGEAVFAEWRRRDNQARRRPLRPRKGA